MNWIALLAAVALVETGNQDLLNTKEGAVGHLQIRQIAVDDLNRYYGTQYKLNDFHDLKLSRWAFIHYGRMYGAKTPEQYARIWNGGPRGNRKKSTISYWERVEALMKKHESK
jgi:hypothetical protein